VLFAAHCGNHTDNAVIVGAYKYNNNAGNAVERFCSEWIQSPFFGETVRLSNDVALCKLNNPVYINKSVTKLVLNNDPDLPSVDDNGIGDDLIVMGFGLEKEHEEGGVIQQTLRDVTVPYVTNEVCNEPQSYNGRIYPEMLCAGKCYITLRYVTLHYVNVYMCIVYVLLKNVYIVYALSQFVILFLSVFVHVLRRFHRWTI